MEETIVCTCLANGLGVIKVIDPFCKMQATYQGVPVAIHEDIGTAVFDSPYDEVAKEILK